MRKLSHIHASPDKEGKKKKKVKLIIEIYELRYLHNDYN